MVENMSSATTDSDFGSDWTIPNNPMKLSMRVLNTEPLEAIHGFEWSRQYNKPEKEFLMMSRKAKNADFVVLYEPYTGESKLNMFERFEVKCGKGQPVEGALGVMIVLDGKPYEIILNPYEAEVKTCKGVTRKVLSVVVKKTEF